MFPGYPGRGGFGYTGRGDYFGPGGDRGTSRSGPPPSAYTSSDSSSDSGGNVGGGHPDDRGGRSDRSDRGDRGGRLGGRPKCIITDSASNVFPEEDFCKAHWEMLLGGGRHRGGGPPGYGRGWGGGGYSGYSGYSGDYSSALGSRGGYYCGRFWMATDLLLVAQMRSEDPH